MTLDEEHHRSEMESKDIQAKVAQLFGQWMTEAAAAGVSQQEVAPGPDERLADTATQLELFSGNGGLSATQWIERFEFSKQVGNWSVAKSWSVILAKLTGQARLWHLKCGRKLKTLDEWKAKFLEEFLPQQRMLNFVEDLASCRQEYGEDLQVFVWRSAAVAAQLGMTPDDIKGHILRGLLPEYEFLVHEMHGRTHADISDLLKDIVKRIKCHGSPTDATKDAPYQLSLRWQATFAGCIPHKAVKGGYDASGETYYVARASHEGAMVPGRAVAMSRAAFVGYNGEEHIKRNFEVLVADCDLEWIKYDGGRLPSGAIQGGITEEGEPLYIGRACHEDSLTNGKVQSLEEKCLIPCGGQEWTYEDFEVLTCKTLSFA